MHIVLDTNTVLSGLLWGGPSRRLIDLARARSLTLGTSLILLAEFAEVIARDKFAHGVQLAGLSAADLVQDYRRLAHLVEPPLPAPASRDPDDDHPVRWRPAPISSSRAISICSISKPIRASRSSPRPTRCARSRRRSNPRSYGPAPSTR